MTIMALVTNDSNGADPTFERIGGAGRNQSFVGPASAETVCDAHCNDTNMTEINSWQ